MVPCSDRDSTLRMLGLSMLKEASEGGSPNLTKISRFPALKATQKEGMHFKSYQDTKKSPKSVTRIQMTPLKIKPRVETALIQGRRISGHFASVLRTTQ